MKLVWHIARKDLRRFAIPVAVWLVLLLAPTIAQAVMTPGIGPHAQSSLDGWAKVTGIWLRMVEGVQLVIGFVLAGAVVLEDPVVDPNAFWPTRPISGARMLGGKLLAAAILFCAAPIAALLPVWLAVGFEISAIAAAAGDFVSRYGTLVLFAFMVAALVRNLAQFVVGALVLYVLFVATGLMVAPVWQTVSLAVRRSRELIVMASVAPAVLLIAGHQFITRRTWRTWGLVAAALLLCLAVRCAWPWDLENSVGRSVLAAPRVDDHASDVVAAPAFTQYQANSLASLVGKTAWHPDGFSVPVLARAPSGEIVMRSGGQMWQRIAGFRMLGIKTPDEPFLWHLTTMPFVFGHGTLTSPQFTGVLEVWSIRPRILGEMPVRVGAEMHHDAMHVRILALLSHESRLDNIYLEERDVRRETLRRWTEDWSRRDAGNERYIDVYFVENRGTQRAVDAWTGDIGLTEINSVVVRYCELGFSWPESHGEPTLVKIRFQRDHAFELPLEVRGVSARGIEQFR